MKKELTKRNLPTVLLTALFTVMSMKAQNPQSYVAEAVGDDNARFILKNDNGYWQISGPRSDENGNNLAIYYGATGVYSRKMTILDNGNIGMGTAAPQSKLQLYYGQGTGTYPTTNSYGDIFQSFRSYNNNLEIGNSRAYNDRKAWILARHSTVESHGKYFSSLHIQPDIGDKTFYRGMAIGYDASTAIPIGTHLAVNGKVGIGTLNPDSKLSVKGNIHAEEVKIDLSVPGPDYVFKEDYNLKPLAEVQDYIKKNGHLPNIPSAKEMKENGIQLGEMNMKLLEKIEELTLYIIELKKGQTVLENQNRELFEQLKSHNKE